MATVGGHHNNRDSSERPTAIVAVTQIVAVDTKVGDQREGQEQAQEEPDSSEGDMTRSRQPDVSVPSSPIPVRESGTFLEGRSVEAVQESVVPQHGSRAELSRRQWTSHVLKVDHASHWRRHLSPR